MHEQPNDATCVVNNLLGGYSTLSVNEGWLPEK
jgi:hypothetical protein